MKKLFLVLIVVAMSAFLFVGCLPGVTPEPEPEPEPEPTPPPTTHAPIIISVDDGSLINSTEAADGIVVNGTGPTYSEIKLFIDGVFAGTGDVSVTGAWIVNVAKTDLGADGDKVLYATAIEAGLAESDKSNEVKFTLDTVAPKIKAVKARGGITFALATAVEVLPFGPGTSALTAATLAVATSANVVTGTWTVNVNAAPPAGNNVTITDPNGVISWYTCAGGDTFAENAPIPGVQFVLSGAPVAGQVSQIVCTAQVAAVMGRVSLTYDEDVSWTQATGGAYTIFNNTFGWDIIPFVNLLAYNETTDTMFWQELFPGVDLSQGQWLTFQVDSVADIAGNAIPVASPETANCTVLSPTVAIGP